MSKEKTLSEIYDSFTKEQKRAVHFIVGEAVGPRPKFTLRCDLLPTRKSHVDNMNIVHDVIKSVCESTERVYLKDFLKKLGFKLGGVKKLDGWWINTDKLLRDPQPCLLITGLITKNGEIDYCLRFLEIGNCICKEFYAGNKVLSIITLREFRKKERENAAKRAERAFIKRDIETTKEVWAELCKK